jgi:hypothetical protein
MESRARSEPVAAASQGLLIRKHGGSIPLAGGHSCTAVAARQNDPDDLATELNPHKPELNPHKAVPAAHHQN